MAECPGSRRISGKPTGFWRLGGSDAGCLSTRYSLADALPVCSWTAGGPGGLSVCDHGWGAWQVVECLATGG